MTFVTGDWLLRNEEPPAGGSPEAPAEYAYVFEVARLGQWWNGWATPVFTLEVLQRFIAVQTEVTRDIDEAPTLNLDPDTGDLLVTDWIAGDDPLAENVQHIHPNDDGTYTLDLGWTFEAMEESDDDWSEWVTEQTEVVRNGSSPIDAMMQLVETAKLEQAGMVVDE